jgi:hypothetical protein
VLSPKGVAAQHITALDGFSGRRGESCTAAPRIRGVGQQVTLVAVLALVESCG